MRRRSRAGRLGGFRFLASGLYCVLTLAAASPGAGADTLAGTAAQLLERFKVRRGLCAVLGNGGLALELARASDLLVHARVPRAGDARDLRARAEAAGLGIDRLVVESSTAARLPFADNLVDIVIADDGGGVLRQLSATEALRAVRPEGMVIAGSAEGGSVKGGGARERLLAWAGDLASPADRVGDEDAWIVLRKPPLAGADDWSHWEHGPDNNPVSADQAIRAPYMTQYLAGPFYIGMPAVTTAAGGRVFLAIGHISHHEREWGALLRLIARNGYNGTVLWERKLPEGYFVHRSAFIATRDTFHMIDGERCLLLDPETGKEKGEVRVPGLAGDWKWMALESGVLYVLAGKPEPGAETLRGSRAFGGWSWDDLSKEYYARRLPFGFGDTLAAFDIAQGKVLWLHKEESLIDSRGLALGGGRFYLYCPDRHLRCLEAESGKVAWTNANPEVLSLIEKPGKGLTSTPGFRTECMAVLTPQALILQGQTRMHVIAVSTADGYLLWTKDKVTNNPNAVFIDGGLVLGVGKGGSHLVLDPVSGLVKEDLAFVKRACTRLTASPDSLFCRGEGTLRFDRAEKRLLVDGGARPGCNDGALPANGMLYIGPWQCDCNLSLIGHLAKCSAGSFRFEHVATESERLERGEGFETVAPFAVSNLDWAMERGDVSRGAATKAKVERKPSLRWQHVPDRAFVPCAPVAAGGHVFLAGLDGRLRALSDADGSLAWSFAAPCPLRAPPTVDSGRVFFGSEDGHAYALEASTGRLLWRFRAAPLERHIMVYGALSSTWPVNTGVLVRNGAAVLAAGIIDSDGTYVYSLDAATGAIRWQNGSSGHLSPELRKGVSPQGNLSVLGNTLLMAGGNQVSPARFDLETGECLEKPFAQGEPKANAGRFVGVFQDRYPIAGGRILYSAPENVATKGSFHLQLGTRALQVCLGGVPPAWNEEHLVLVSHKHGKLACFDARKAAAWLEGPSAEKGGGRGNWSWTLAQGLESDGALRWQTDFGEPTHFETLSTAVSPDAVVAVVRYQQRLRSQPQWFVAGLDARDGKPFFEHELPGSPLPGGLLVGSRGQIVVVLVDGRVLCFG